MLERKRLAFQADGANNPELGIHVIGGVIVITHSEFFTWVRDIDKLGATCLRNHITFHEDGVLLDHLNGGIKVDNPYDFPVVAVHVICAAVVISDDDVFLFNRRKLREMGAVLVWDGETFDKRLGHLCLQRLTIRLADAPLVLREDKRESDDA